MTLRVLAAAAAAAALLGADPGNPRAPLRATATAYYADVAAIAKITGRDTTMDYYERLVDDLDLLGSSAPPGYTAAAWAQTAGAISTLDLSLANQLLAGSFVPMASIRGLGETFVRSSQDGTMQPVAIYVPSGYLPGKPAALAVFLHGRPQPETRLIAPPFVTHLADATNTIVVAPYGRGYYDFRGSERDVYDALDAALQAFTVDPRKRYLLGYSMGGFSVFHVAPVRPNAWSAVMSIAGSLLGSEAHPITSLMRNTPFYILTGSADDSIPTQYPTVTAVYLHDAGLPVSFYSEPGGEHWLGTLVPILTQAWNDMETGIVRAPEVSVGIGLPSAVPPAATTKT